MFFSLLRDTKLQSLGWNDPLCFELNGEWSGINALDGSILYCCSCYMRNRLLSFNYGENGASNDSVIYSLDNQAWCTNTERASYSPPENSDVDLLELRFTSSSVAN